MSNQPIQTSSASTGTKHAMPVERTSERPTYAPRTDIYETEGSVVLVADMPGVDEKSVDITLEDHVLTITGKTRDVAPTGYRRVYGEFETGDFQRSFVLSDRADAGRIQASVQNGVLRVEVPKAKPVQKRIPVSSGRS